MFPGAEIASYRGSDCEFKKNEAYRRLAIWPSTFYTMGSYWSAVNRAAKGHSFRLREEWKEVKAQRLKQSQAEWTRGAHGGSSVPGLQVEGRAGGWTGGTESAEGWGGRAMVRLHVICEDGEWEADTRISFPSRVLMWVVFQETPAVAKKKKSYRAVPIKLVHCNFTIVFYRAE